MKDFTFYNPTKIIFGQQALQEIPVELKQRHFQKIFLTFGKGSLKDSRLHKDLVGLLQGFEVKEFWGIEPNPRVETLREATKIAKKFAPDLILAVGGGSVIDASKLLIASVNSSIDPWDLVLDISQAKVFTPLATILTVSATGSEMNNGAVITNWKKNEKLSFGDVRAFPIFSILNPEYTTSLTGEQTAYGIVDIFSHVCEQYLHTTTNALIQDRFAEGILLTLIETAPKLLADLTNYDFRSTVMWSSTMALNRLIGMGVAQDWASHRIEHQLSAFYDIPHGAGLAIVTPRWMPEISPQKFAKFVQYGHRVWNLSGNDEAVVQEAISKTYDFFKSLGIKMNLNEWGIDDQNFPLMISRLDKDKIGEFPLTKEQLTHILNNCLTN